MKVWVIYEKDRYGGSQVGKIYSNHDAAIRDQMDDSDYLKKSQGYSEKKLRKYAETLLEEHEVISEY